MFSISPTDDLQSKQDKALIEYLNKLKASAVSAQPTKKLKTYANYYSSRFGDTNSTAGVGSANTSNICKPIIETKTTLVLDKIGRAHV